MRFTNCLVPAVASDVELSRLDVIVDSSSGRIVRLCAPTEAADDADAPIVDCGGGVLSPGFIDLQLNGAFSVDFSDPAITSEGILAVLRRLPAFGVTSVCATLISSSAAQYAHVVPLLRAIHAAGAPADCARLLGIHFEGPFMTPARKGAHAAELLREPVGGYADLAALYGVSDADVAAGLVRLVTLAPELPGALAAVSGLAARGIVASIGHTAADAGVAEAALRAGAGMVTHLYNAMEPLRHREPGVIGVALGRLPAPPAAAVESAGLAPAPPSPSAPPHAPFDPSPLPAPFPGPPAFGLIVDGVHVAPQAVTLALRAAPAGTVLVTDAMRAMGEAPGLYRYGPLGVEVKGGGGPGDAYAFPHVVLEGTSTLAGAVLPLDACVRNVAAFSGCSPATALATVTANPARVLRVSRWLGTLAPGAWADLVLLRGPGDLTPLRTWVAGRCVFGAAGGGEGATDPQS